MPNVGAGLFMVRWPRCTPDDYLVLVSRRNPGVRLYPNLLQAPGGSTLSGPGECETVMDCAMRELTEETGLISLDINGYLQALPPWTGIGPNGLFYSMSFFWVGISPGSINKARQMEPEKAGPWVWMRITDLLSIPDQLIPGMPVVLANLQTAILANPKLL